MYQQPKYSGENNLSQATTPDLDDSISFSDDVNHLDVDVEVDVDSVPTKKPHFLDYDAVPPPDFIDQFDRVLSFASPPALSQNNQKTAAVPANNLQKNREKSSSGEQLKMDKKFEKDGEISDYELAASGYTKKEFTQDDNTLGLLGTAAAIVDKPRKHFLDENPIPPDYMLHEHQLREHRSLDRNFERHNEQKSAFDLHAQLPGFRSSRERFKDVPPGATTTAANITRMPKGSAWTQSFDSRYDDNNSAAAAAAAEKVDTFGPKVECVYSLLSMLGSNDPLEMSKKFHELSKTPESCNALRRSGCIQLLVQMIHADGGPDEVRKWSGMALHNVVHSHPDEKCGRREAKVLRLLDQIMDYCNFLRTLLQSGGEAIADDADRHPLAAMSSLMKVSFDEEHRHAMCELGALQAIPSLVHLDHAVHGPKPENQCCNSLRRFALMALTNLTFGDENNKALLCSQKLFMEALVAQLDSAPDDLLQVTASVLRNLSWRADAQMKAVLNEIGTVTALAKAAMKNKCENTLKAILSALWNLSAHCSTNKAEFCAVEGALSFIVCMLTYEGPSKTLKIIENAGGILRNVSSHIAVREDYRQILREHNCLSILLQQLKSESLTVVSNSCGTLWNLSARCPEDQRFLWDNGAVPMLRSLINSKHAMISEGSACALKNLLNFRPSAQNTNHLDPIARSLNLKKLPTLNVRKQKALEQELGSAAKSHSETCDNLDTMNPKDRPTYDATATVGSSSSSSLQRHRFPLHGPLNAVVGVGVVGSQSSTQQRLTRSAMLTKSESRDSVFSAKSDGVVYDHLMRSQSASDANRKLQQNSRASPATTYNLERDMEPAEEQPIDYSQKYTEHITKSINDHRDQPENGSATYQETDLDQPTDFSLRYAENQIESDLDLSPRGDNVPGNSTVRENQTCAAPLAKARQENTAANNAGGNGNGGGAGGGNEIILILEDSVKCYQTEDTPYIISNAASVTDLRSVTNVSNKIDETDVSQTGNDNSEATSTSGPVAGQLNSRKFSKSSTHHHNSHHQNAPAASGHLTNPYGSGSYTPEKPVNYCEEGTPGYFSRYESFSSLDESPQAETTQKENTSEQAVSPNTQEDKATTASVSQTEDNAEKSSLSPNDNATAVVLNQQTQQINSALETPLMFSRRSSMDSLAEEDVGPLDDKSSVVSDFSRLASGVISPSEIPDSPTQSMPQSPRRNSSSGVVSTPACFSAGVSPSAQRSQSRNPTDSSSKRCLRSVFEDDLNTFNVENTPAQFSTATSLSNLSILDDEQPPATQQKSHQIPPAASTNTISEGEEEEDDVNENNDDILLASCINIGMNRSSIAVTSSSSQRTDKIRNHQNTEMAQDEPKHYYTEDTPALMSKVGSNTNLSAISICSSNNDTKEEAVYEVVRRTNNDITSSGGEQGVPQQSNKTRHSLNLSDISSNASESGAAVGIDILQQCIRDGMQKPCTQSKEKTVTRSTVAASGHMDAIAMLRRGGNTLPPYSPVNDEMSKYRVEDSPCNFSVMSGLSNLTVGSSLVGPAVQLQGEASNLRFNKFEKSATNNKASSLSKSDENRPPPLQSGSAAEDARREAHWQDDSLSSLSIESEDDTNLLSQAIAAGCNRPKSNLGFATNLTSTGKHVTTSLSSSQPIPINAATSASSLSSQVTARNFERQQQKHQKHNYDPMQAGNESFSSVESSDSNDNQSKSLFELCILTGMHKNSVGGVGGGSSTSTGSRGKHAVGASRHAHLQRSSKTDHNTTQSNPNLKQFDSLPMQGKQLTPNRHVRERDRRDEKLLMECINTGIMKKIGESGKQSSSSSSSLLTREALQAHNLNQPKNGQATSAAAAQGEEEISHQTTSANFTQHNSSSSINTSISTITTTIITAAPGVEKTNINNNNSNNSNMVIAPEISSYPMAASNINTINISHVEDIKNQRSPLMQPQTQHIIRPANVNHQNHAKDHETTNDTGYKAVEHQQQEQCDSMGADGSSSNTTQSDESNQSFIMDTTVTLDNKSLNSTSLSNCPEKHKDPDLMLKSVERLTLEFVSSAEQLRTGGHGFVQATISQSISNDSSESKNKRPNHSSSNNTWNDDTCPNDVSFPSVSVTAPKVASLSYDDDEDEDQTTTADYKEFNDFAENTPINEELPTPDMSLDFDNIGMQQQQQQSYLDNISQPMSLDYTYTGGDTEEEKTLIKEKDSNSSGAGLTFKLGGIVQTAATTPSLFFSTNSMTNSTFIAQEARKLAENLHSSLLEEEQEELSFSVNSFDLDNIRPPSGMESLNISGYYHDMTQPNSLQRQSSTPHSPQMSFKSPKFPRKHLAAGLVARRALGQMAPHLTGSAESVNSSCNLLLDNIKPPSLMDELLDSMISVASIQSELADDCPSMATTVTVSNYETCPGGGVDFDGDTITLQSCCDDMLPRDDENTLNDGTTTPLPSDYELSSIESTPKKLAKRTLTPKQKRKIIKDRFKTYTIEADDLQIDNLHETQNDETLAIEITQLDDEDVNKAGDKEDMLQTPPGGTPRSRRRTSQDRYKTQTIFYNDLQQQLNSLDSQNDEVSSCCSLKQMTQRFTFITSNLENTTPEPSEEPTSLEYEQNSETESCHNYPQTNGIHLDNGVEKQQLQQNGNDEDDEEEQQFVIETARPKIIKPADKLMQETNCLEEETKAIRGCKKAPYVSPYSMKFTKSNNNDSKPQQQIAGNVNLQSNFLRKRNGNVAASAIQAASATNTKLAQRKTLTKEMAAEPAVVPVAPSLERQGTFVKDEPSLDSANVPVVITSPTKQKHSKLPTKRQTSFTSSSNHTSPQKLANTRKLPKLPTSTGIQTYATAKRFSAGGGGGSISKPQRANSNVNIRLTANAARIAVLSTRVSTTTPPSRSNSSLNSSNAAAAKAAQNAAAKINQAQSRIAGIWRRVDDAKNKQQPAKTNKLYGVGGTAKGSQQKLAGNKLNNEVNSKTQPTKLIRSTTFDNSPAVTTVATKPPQQQQAASKISKIASIGGSSKIAQRQTLIVAKK